MKKTKLMFLLAAVVLIFVAFQVGRFLPYRGKTPPVSRATTEQRKFEDRFQRTELLKEGGRMNESTSGDWWVNAGAYLYVENGIAETIQGALPENDERRLRYFSSNPDETDDGFHPQNIFRLVTRTQWSNLEQQAFYKITAYNLSKSVHRFEANAILLFNRYQDGDNLYYTGLRVDGSVVIKKKIKGSYFTIAEKKTLPGTYNRDSNPNLIPLNEWIGLKSVVHTESDGTVNIQVFLDIGKTGIWTLALEGKDNGVDFGGVPFLKQGYAGIRTDFMDVQFSDYSITETQSSK